MLILPSLPIYYTNSLMIVPELTNYLQLSPGMGFPPTPLGKVKQIHTHKGFPTSVCSFIKTLL